MRKTPITLRHSACLATQWTGGCGFVGAAPAIIGGKKIAAKNMRISSLYIRNIWNLGAKLMTSW